MQMVRQGGSVREEMCRVLDGMVRAPISTVRVGNVRTADKNGFRLVAARELPAKYLNSRPTRRLRESSRWSMIAAKLDHSNDT